MPSLSCNRPSGGLFLLQLRPKSAAQTPKHLVFQSVGGVSQESAFTALGSDFGDALFAPAGPAFQIGRLGGNYSDGRDSGGGDQTNHEHDYSGQRPGWPAAPKLFAVSLPALIIF